MAAAKGNDLASLPLFGPDMLADPYPVYARLRAEDPVHWHEPFQAWLLTRYDDVSAAFHDLRFSSERTERMRELAGRQGLEPFFDFLSKRLLYADPPRHTRLRGLMNKAFTPHAVEAMRSHIQELVDGFLDRVHNQGRMDIVQDLAYPLPGTVILEMLGVPVADLPQLKNWSDEFVRYFGKHPAQVTAEEWERAQQSVTAEMEYFRLAMVRLHEQPRPCLLTALEQARDGSDQLSEVERFGNANLLLVAGHETTTNLISTGTLALLRHPDQLAKLRAEPALLPGAIEELLRYVSPTQFTHRVAREDITLGGKTIRKGQFVFLMLGAANRDPERFADPDRLDIARADNHHLAFGAGHHFCLGAPLARLEAQIAFGTLLRRCPNLRLGAGPIVYRPEFNLRGLERLEVQFS